MPFGGTGLDSKFARYQLFANSPYAIPTILVPPAASRGSHHLLDLMRQHGLVFPIIAKPDAGNLSVSVSRFDSLSALASFLERQRLPYLVQTYVPDRHEFSIYYYRFHNQACGHILDLTERILPEVTGDGIHSLRDLVDLREDWEGFTDTLKRGYSGDLDYIPRSGEVVVLTTAAGLRGGATFVDRREHITPLLAQSIDVLAQEASFFLGKFDVKAPSLEHLKNAKGLKILEVNGLPALRNSIFDLRYTYAQTLRLLAEQLRIVFLVAKTAPPRVAEPSRKELWWRSWRFLKDRWSLRKKRKERASA